MVGAGELQNGTELASVSHYYCFYYSYPGSWMKKLFPGEGSDPAGHMLLVCQLNENWDLTIGFDSMKVIVVLEKSNFGKVVVVKAWMRRVQERMKENNWR